MTDRIPAPPPGLRSLAEVDSPDVVRAALRRFRRRLLIWLLVLVLVLGSWFGLRRFFTFDYLPHQLRDARGEVIGRTLRSGPARAVVLEAKRHEEKYGIRVVFSAGALKRSEHLHVESAPASCLNDDVSGQLGGPTVGAVYQLVSGDHATEVWVADFAGRAPLPVNVVAISPRGDRRVQPDPPLMTELPCETILEFDSRTEHVRHLGTIVLDPKKLGVSEAIWRDRD